MQSPSMAASFSFHYPIPKRFIHPSPSHKRNPNPFFPSTKLICSSSSSSSSPPQTTHHRSLKQTRQHSIFEDSLPFHQFSSPSDDSGLADQNPEGLDSEFVCRGGEDSVGVLSKVRWTDLKAVVGQRVSIEGIVSSVSVVVRDRHLALPHVAVPDIRYIDWDELKREGFNGVVFDKDNTLTTPYSLAQWSPLQPSIERCKAVFGHDIAVFSNSAGLAEYDHDGSKAIALEAQIGIRVLRHRVKKPAGTAEEIEKHFGCPSSQLIMVGDRPLTDIVYGNRNGFLTILVEPLSRAEEPFIVRQIRKLEMTLLNHWLGRGLKTVGHKLLSDVTQCVKDPSNL
ncbi:PREDICTED: uncharacterized protein LOC104803221 [Tarenaya hassleriana]|uniref:uncharacterized protein LOC104803221 n=1 Tax=Tarenaya hassleriana TaxID=28532 RepID=UPI00053C7053|nr:PREDICTED: uncharacterized protein LOC104803221 [Tarenaya hassleriana]